MARPWPKPKDRQKAPPRAPAPRQATRTARAIAPPGPAVPALSQPDRIDLELRQRAARLEGDFFGLCEVIREVLDGRIHEHFGFADPETYLEERIGLSYRAVRRRLAVLEAVRMLPPGEQDQARTALAELGSHKAGILAPVLRISPSGDAWRPWVDRARAMSTLALQEAVSQRLGLKPRGATADAWARFLARLLRLLPEDAHARVTAIVEACQRAARAEQQPSAVLLLAFDCLQRDLADQGVTVG